jgi:hypothetical protein
MSGWGLTVATELSELIAVGFQPVTTGVLAI